MQGIHQQNTNKNRHFVSLLAIKVDWCPVYSKISCELTLKRVVTFDIRHFAAAAISNSSLTLMPTPADKGTSPTGGKRRQSLAISGPRRERHDVRRKLCALTNPARQELLPWQGRQGENTSHQFSSPRWRAVVLRCGAIGPVLHAEELR